MKHLLYISFLLCFAGCSSNASDEHVAVDSSGMIDSNQYTIERQRIAAQHADSVHKADSLSSAQKVTPDSTFQASFRFMYTRAYCGGAKPSDEMINNLETPKLLTNSTLLLKNHFTGTEYQCVISPDGEATVAITEGKYDIFLTKNVNTETGFDPKCTLWTKQLLQTIKVSDNGKMQEVTIHFVCNPCDEKMKQRQ